tara:strand:+ start:4294 stop:5799 length:1506 start_codon:yes stop_codon:yes gene_type:complete
MATKEVLELEVKSNIKSVTNDQKDFNKELKNTKKDLQGVNKEGEEVVQEMQILGVSLKGLKASWDTAAKGAKFLFRTVKAGIISTGIGLFIVALGSVATFFSKTKKGAEILETALAGLGAAFNVIVDRVAKFGGGIVKLLAGTKGGLKDMKDSFKDIGKEIVADTLFTMALKKQTQELVDSQRALNVETAQRRADIEELKLIAEDVTKSEQVRLKAAQDAFGIENKLLNDRIRNAEKELSLEQKRQSTILDPLKEDLDKIAQLEINVANIRGESTTKQIELNNKINAIQAEGTAKRQQALADLKTADAERLGDLQALVKESVKLNDELEKADNKYLDNFLKNRKKEMTAESLLAGMKKQLANQGLNLLSEIATEGSALAKATAVTQATISGIEGVQNAYTTAQKSPFTLVFPGYPLVQAGLAAAFSAVQIKKILSANSSGSSGGSVGSGGGGGGTPAPQMMSGAFDLGGGMEPEPVKAFVLTDEMSNSQNQLANIRRRATI